MRYQGTCAHCSVDWAEEVALARSNTLRNFDGLCIDCMDRSGPKRGDGDVDYWRQLESIDGRWNVNCRVRHEAPSWYISWCGRAEHRQKLIDRHKEVNRGVRRSGVGLRALRGWMGRIGFDVAWWKRYADVERGGTPGHLKSVVRTERLMCTIPGIARHESAEGRSIAS